MKFVIGIILLSLQLVWGAPNNGSVVIPEPRAGCSFTHSFTASGQQAYLRSPRWPRNYPNNADCSYELSSPPGTQIHMDCTEVNIEYIQNCVYDRLTISLSGDSSLSDGMSICGRGTFTRTSEENSLAVGFKSDNSNPSTSSPFRFQCLLTVIGEVENQQGNESQPGGGTSEDQDGFADQTCSCGTRNEAQRIVGGVNAHANEFPWRVALYSKRLGVFCGATIISPNWLMTAAHCTKALKGAELWADVGDHDYTITHDADNELIKVDRYVDHPQYNDKTQDNDISLLHLERTLTYNRGVS